MHIAPYDNRNQAIIGADHALVPLVYFNIVKLKRGESFTSTVPGYETCIVPATGTTANPKASTFQPARPRP
jgi:5-deoxy-glucuronate isomerase